MREICETVDFHGGRPWTCEVAVWDLVGKALGGRSDRLLGYASSGEHAAPDARRVSALRDRGIRAVKLRLPLGDWRDGVAVVERVRDEVGMDIELMVDANQGWRMPGDRTPRRDVTAARCARELERLGVCWLEEPLRTDDVVGVRGAARADGDQDRGRRDGA